MSGETVSRRISDRGIAEFRERIERRKDEDMWFVAVSLREAEALLDDRSDLEAKNARLSADLEAAQRINDAATEWAQAVDAAKAATRHAKAMFGVRQADRIAHDAWTKAESEADRTNEHAVAMAERALDLLAALAEDPEPEAAPALRDLSDDEWAAREGAYWGVGGAAEDPEPPQAAGTGS